MQVKLFLFAFLISLSHHVWGEKTKVVVTGAGGRTGQIVFRKLLNSAEYDPIAVVRTKKSIKGLIKIGGKSEQIHVADVSNYQELVKTFEGSTKIIMCTSAKPKIKLLSLLKVMILKLFRKSARPEFYFPAGGSPYEVDWLGAKNQIDAAKEVGISQFVFLSSMGGTQPDNFLNTIGRKSDDEKSGNILLWKRKAEKYLIESKIPYTIVHPGGLVDKVDDTKQVILGVDDELLSRKSRTIAREDVADVCVEALNYESAKYRAFDIISEERDKNIPNKQDWKTFFSNFQNCKYE